MAVISKMCPEINVHVVDIDENKIGLWNSEDLNELPVYELISGATLAFAAFMLILPGFATDLVGLLLVIPFTRKIILSRFIKKKSNKNFVKRDYIDGDYEDLSDDNEKKLWNNT